MVEINKYNINLNEWTQLVNSIKTQNKFNNLIIPRISYYKKYCKNEIIFYILSLKNFDMNNIFFQYKTNEVFISMTPDIFYQRNNKKVRIDIVTGNINNIDHIDSLNKKLHKIRNDVILKNLKVRCKNIIKDQVYIKESYYSKFLYNKIFSDINFIDDLETIDLLHPSILNTGEPLEDTYIWLRNNESIYRNYYSAPLGFISKDSSVMFLGLKSLYIKNDIIELYTESDIFSDNNPYKLWEELNVNELFFKNSISSTSIFNKTVYNTNYLWTNLFFLELYKLGFNNVFVSSNDYNSPLIITAQKYFDNIIYGYNIKSTNELFLGYCIANKKNNKANDSILLASNSYSSFIDIYNFGIKNNLNLMILSEYDNNNFKINNINYVDLSNIDERNITYMLSEIDYNFNLNKPICFNFNFNITNNNNQIIKFLPRLWLSNLLPYNCFYNNISELFYILNNFNCLIIIGDTFYENIIDLFKSYSVIVDISNKFFLNKLNVIYFTEDFLNQNISKYYERIIIIGNIYSQSLINFINYSDIELISISKEFSKINYHKPIKHFIINELKDIPFCKNKLRNLLLDNQNKFYLEYKNNIFFLLSQIITKCDIVYLGSEFLINNFFRYAHFINKGPIIEINNNNFKDNLINIIIGLILNYKKSLTLIIDDINLFNNLNNFILLKKINSKITIIFLTTISLKINIINYLIDEGIYFHSTNKISELNEYYNHYLYNKNLFIIEFILNDESYKKINSHEEN